jgi:hypothetical protein
VITDAETIIEQARHEEWGDPGLAAATVGRPTWWLLSPAPWNDLRAILATAIQDSGPVETWQGTAMWGASALAPEDPSRMAALIAGVCLADSSSPAPVSYAAAMLSIGSEVAAQRKAHPPADYLAQAGAELAAAGVLADPLSFIAQVRAHLHGEEDREASTESHLPPILQYPSPQSRREHTYGVPVTADTDQVSFRYQAPELRSPRAPRPM